MASSVREYVIKRVLRIYPGFIAASVVLLFVVAPLAGAPPISPADMLGTAWNALTLAGAPPVKGAFAGLTFSDLDGAMWTIRYEFDCYLAVILIGLTGMLRRPLWLMLGAAALLTINGLELTPPWVVPHVPELGFLPYDVRLAGIFLVGMLYFLLRDRIPINGRGALVAAVALFALMFFKPVAEAAFAILGGYLIFWLARVELLKPLSARLRDDISYGLYLYAWPISGLLIYYRLTDSPWLLLALTLPLAALCGFISWRLIERPFIRLKPGARRRRSGASSSTPVLPVAATAASRDAR